MNLSNIELKFFTESTTSSLRDKPLIEVFHHKTGKKGY